MSKEQFTVQKCAIYGTGDNWLGFTFECSATVEARVQEKVLRTKSGDEYVARHKEYALIICHGPEIDGAFDTLEKVEQYEAYFFSRGEIKHSIKNIIPLEIDLDGDWTFRISDEDGKKLFELAKLG